MTTYVQLPTRSKEGSVYTMRSQLIISARDSLLGLRNAKERQTRVSHKITGQENRSVAI